MADIQIKDKVFTPFLSEEQIQKKIEAVAQRINTDYEGKTPLMVSVLNGSFRFMNDLFRYISIPVEAAFVRVSSYQGTQSSGKIKEVLGLDIDIKGRHVIVVEDIVDTGLTINQIKEQLVQRMPDSFEVAALLLKPDCLRQEVSLRYLGFEIPNEFVVGYGLDYDNLGRELNDIYKLKVAFFPYYSFRITNIASFKRN